MPKVRPASITGDRRIADALVISEVAFAMVLLVGAGLLIRSFGELLRVEPGFDPEDVIEVDQLDFPSADRFQLQGHLAAVGADADYRSLHCRQPIVWHQVRLFGKTG